MDFTERRKIRAAIQDLTGSGRVSSISRSVSMPRSASYATSPFSANKTFSSSVQFTPQHTNIISRKHDPDNFTTDTEYNTASCGKPSVTNVSNNSSVGGRSSLAVSNKYLNALAARSAAGLQRSASLRTASEATPRTSSTVVRTNSLFRNLRDRYCSKLDADGGDGMDSVKNATDEKELNIQVIALDFFYMLS